MEAVRGGNLEVWVASLKGGAWAAALLNRGPVKSAISIEWAHLNISSDAEMHIRSIWKAQDMGSHTISYTEIVAPHGIALLRLTPA